MYGDENGITVDMGRVQTSASKPLRSAAAQASVQQAMHSISSATTTSSTSQPLLDPAGSSSSTSTRGITPEDQYTQQTGPGPSSLLQALRSNSFAEDTDLPLPSSVPEARQAVGEAAGAAAAAALAAQDSAQLFAWLATELQALQRGLAAAAQEPQSNHGLGSDHAESSGPQSTLAATPAEAAAAGAGAAAPGGGVGESESLGASLTEKLASAVGLAVEAAMVSDEARDLSSEGLGHVIRAAKRTQSVTAALIQGLQAAPAASMPSAATAAAGHGAKVKAPGALNPQPAEQATPAGSVLVLTSAVLHRAQRFTSWLLSHMPWAWGNITAGADAVHQPTAVAWAQQEAGVDQAQHLELTGHTGSGSGIDGSGADEEALGAGASDPQAVSSWRRAWGQLVLNQGQGLPESAAAKTSTNARRLLRGNMG